MYREQTQKQQSQCKDEKIENKKREKDYENLSTKHF